MNKNKILFVDDEAGILNAVKRILANQEYETYYVASAREALDILPDTDINIVVTDLHMPEFDGFELLKQIKQKYPTIVRIVLSGETDLTQVLAAVNDGNIFQFIPKPWVEETFLSVLKQAVDYYNLCREKDNLQMTLRHRNDAYTRMLKKMETQFMAKKAELLYVRGIYCKIIDYLLEESKENKRDLNEDVVGQLIKQIMEEYINILPIVQARFSIDNLIVNLRRNFKMQVEINASSTFEPTLKCLGNLNLLLLTINTIFKFLVDSETDRKFKYTLTTQEYPDVVIISFIVEIGYVDGVKALIKKDGLLTKGNLDFCVRVLNLIGQPYKISTTTTFINQNASLVTIVANVLPR